MKQIREAPTSNICFDDRRDLSVPPR